ncbi:2080_t:CDS:2 [Diversispora eburnea]|uniref:2080_t:CDS:1 n=1 Tax=Diversispora eburnea TaxID=1213867 RepID=A0A9N9BPL5_9GLOM|nr:2080_t:CDS:2 [Diversispora eburnea]
MLILGKPVSRSLIAVIFLPSTSPSNRRRSIHPYYDNAIEKYFNQPCELIFQYITYPIYHRKFKSTSTIPISDAEDYFYQQLLLQIPIWNDE